MKTEFQGMIHGLMAGFSTTAMATVTQKSEKKKRHFLKLTVGLLPTDSYYSNHFNRNNLTSPHQAKKLVKQRIKDLFRFHK